MSIKTNPQFQYTYSRTPLYCLIDASTTKITSCGFWFDLDGELSAPEFLPVGSSAGRDKYGSCCFKNFVPRGWTSDEKLIDEILAES